MNKSLLDEATRASNAEKALSDKIAAETSRAQAKEQEILDKLAASGLLPHGTSCLDIKTREPDSKDGLYFILPDTATKAIEAYCDMSVAQNAERRRVEGMFAWCYFSSMCSLSSSCLSCSLSFFFLIFIFTRQDDGRRRMDTRGMDRRACS